jgi:hypothetical protein
MEAHFFLVTGKKAWCNNEPLGFQNHVEICTGSTCYRPKSHLNWYVLIYTDDFLCISMDPKKILDSIGMHFKLKPKLIKTPEVYLGADLGCFSLPDNPSKQQWSMSSMNYVQQAVANVEKDLDEIGKRLSTKITSPRSSTYQPELNVSPVLDAECANYFQS